MSTDSLNKTSAPSMLSEYWCHTTVQVSKCVFTWSIDNFSMSRQKHGDFMQSTKFFAGPQKELECLLYLFPKGDASVPEDEFVSIYPKLIGNKSKKPFFVHFKISIVDSNGQLCNCQTFSVNVMGNPSKSQFAHFSESPSSRVVPQSLQMFPQARTLTLSPSILHSYGLQVQPSSSEQRSTLSSEMKLPTFPRFAKLAALRSADNRMLQNDQLKIRCVVSVTYEETNDNYSRTQQKDLNPVFQIVQLSEDLESILRDQKYCDVKLVASNLVAVNAHKNILSSRSPVFEAMFGHDMEESKNNIVNITDIHSHVLEDFLLFLYTGRSKFLEADPFRWSDVVELMQASDKYDVSTLKKMCADRLGENLSIENACEILFVADAVCADSLKENAICFIHQNTSLVVRTAGWYAVSKKSPSVIADVFVAKSDKTGY